MHLVPRCESGALRVRAALRVITRLAHLSTLLAGRVEVKRNALKSALRRQSSAAMLSSLSLPSNGDTLRLCCPPHMCACCSSQLAARCHAAQVHFDCYLGKLDIVSSRLSALLGKNEIVPEVCTRSPGATARGSLCGRSE